MRTSLCRHRPEKLNVRSGVEASDYPVALSYRHPKMKAYSLLR